jgi:putative peptidoglycan lipid II flippase
MTVLIQRKSPRRRFAVGLAGAAGLIAVLTVLARVAGFGRIVIFSSTVGLTDLGDVYQTINTLPNIIFEIVAGGALAAVVVPLVAGALAREDVREVNQLSSALLTWSLLILTPLTILLAVFAHPIASLLLGNTAGDAQVATGTRMLIVFAPQLVLYGVGVVLTGILQAHHRFSWPAIAPMLSSLTVIGAYILFGYLAGRGADLGEITRRDELMLSVGTTVGVAVLTLCLIIPLRGIGVRIRPTVRFPSGANKTVRALLTSGISTVGAQYLTLLIVLLLLQSGPSGTVVAFNLVQTIFLLPWAVLAVPVATSAFPRLSASYSSGDLAGYQQTVRISARLVIVLCAAAAAVLMAVAHPIAEVLMTVARGRTDVNAVSDGIVAFAPGLLGYGLLALLSRALYATRASLSTALVTIGGWLAVIAANLIFVQVFPDARVAAVGIGNSIGMTVVGIALVVLIGHRTGRLSLQGLSRTTIAAIFAGVVAGGAGYTLVAALPAGQGFGAVWSGSAAALTVLVCFMGILALIDRPTLQPVLNRLLRQK